MARHLQLPADLNLDHPRALAPQWMTDNHDHSAPGVQNINSALVDKPIGSEGGGKLTNRGGSEPPDQRQDPSKPADQRTWAGQDRNWAGQDRTHPPQQDRFVPQGRPKPAQGGEHGTPAKGVDRWRNDAQSKWGHVNSQADTGSAPWGSPGRGAPADPFLAGDNWNRQRQQRSGIPGAPPGRADTGRWNSNAGWGAEDHFAPRGATWDAGHRGGGFGEHGRDAPGAGRGKGFSNVGRGRGLGKEPLGPAASYQRWTPGQASPQPAPPFGAPTPTKIEDIIVPKLGSGPQQHKYTMEQMLTIYAELSERGAVSAPEGAHFEFRGAPSLLSEEAQHLLLTMMDAIAQQMLEGGFASKAERRLAGRLHALLEKSQPPTAPPTTQEELGNSAAAAEWQVQDALPQKDRTVPLGQHQPQNEGKQLQNAGGTPFAASESQSAPVVDDKATRLQASSSSQALPQPADQWFYKDPSGNIQGPYTRQAIEEWNASGFFPLDLPLSTSRDTTQFCTLEEVLKVWRAPPESSAPKSAAADSLLAQQGSMQTQNLGASSAASMRLDAAESGMQQLRQSGFLAQQGQQSQPKVPAQQQQLPILERPASHPYLNHRQIQQQGSSQGFAGLSALNGQLSAVGIRPESSLEQQLQQLQGLQQHQQRPGNFHGQQQQQDLLAQLQGHPHSQQHFPGLQPDPLMSLMSSLAMNRVSSGASLVPIGSGALPRAPYQPPLGGPAFQPQHAMQQAGGHQGLQDLLPQLGMGPNSFEQQNHSVEQPPLSSMKHFSSPFLGSEQLPGQPFPRQDDHLHGHSSAAQLAKEHQDPPQHLPSLGAWLQSGKLPEAPSPQQPLQQPERQREEGLGIPPHTPAPIVGPPPRRLRPAVSNEPPVHGPSDLDLDLDHSFTKVQKPKRPSKDQVVGSLEAEITARAPGPARKPVLPPPPPPERASSQEWQRPTTLAEAAGLRGPQQAEPEPNTAPWAAKQQPGGSGTKSLLDIQKEEVIQAKARAERNAAQQAVAVGAAPPHQANTWGKAVLQSTWPAPSVTSLKEIQEQEKRRSAATAPPPPAAVSGGLASSWLSGPSRTASMRDRLHQDSSKELDAATLKHSPLPRTVQPKAASQQRVTAVAREPDDDIFWDYGPQPTADAKPVAAKLVERPVNGASIANGARPAVEESAPDEAPTDEGLDACLSPEFAGWCKSRLRELRDGDDDLTLVQFLMTVASNAEVAEYMTEYLGRTAAVSAFSNEFIKRKLAEQNGKKKGRAVKKAAQGNSGGVAKGAVGVAPVSAGGATGWSKMPKKKKKGQKVDAAMLGFETGTNYAALEKMEG